MTDDDQGEDMIAALSTPSSNKADELAKRIDRLQGRIEELEIRVRAAELKLVRKPPASFGG